MCIWFSLSVYLRIMASWGLLRLAISNFKAYYLNGVGSKKYILHLFRFSHAKNEMTWMGPHPGRIQVDLIDHPGLSEKFYCECI